MSLLVMLLGPAVVALAIVLSLCLMAGLSALATWGWSMVAWGVTQILVGSMFNRSTPMQQPTPVIGAAVVVLGIGCLLLAI